MWSTFSSRTDFMKLMTRRIIPCLAAGALLTVFASGLQAQKYTVGMSADVTGSSNGPMTAGLGASTVSNRYDSSFGSYPSLDFSGHGQRYSIQSTYSFGINRSY